MIDKESEILDLFGKILIDSVRDLSLSISMDIAKYTTVNPVQKKQYKELSSLTDAQKESVCDLLSDTISDVLYNFLHLFDEYAEDEDAPEELSMKLILKKDDIEYNVLEISEEIGSEIARNDEDGWIQKFSEIKCKV